MTMPSNREHDLIDERDPSDPTCLPLFAAPTPRPGRVRGGFAMVGAGMDEAAPAPAPGSWRVGRPYNGGLDWSLVAVFRKRASDQLSAALGAQRERFTAEAQRERGRAIIVELLAAEAAERVGSGRDSWSLGEQEAMTAAVFDAVFGLGRLQPLVDDDTVENIIIIGCDRVSLELVDGRIVPGPPVADSDQELIDFLVFLASRSEVNARSFSEANPRLHMRLDGGSRLAAAAWVTPRPSVVIRRHRLRQVSLDDMVGLGMLSAIAASFLSAAVQIGKTIVVAGSQAAGKTTLVRALCGQIPKWEGIGTFETEYELHLHELPDRHPIVHAWEARPGSGEKGADGRPAGEFTLSDALHDSFRFDLSRQIVGEVRGPEILAMLKAMESSRGSICTTHAPNAHAAIGKLVTCAMEAGAHVTHDYAVRAIAAAVNIIVHVHLETRPLPDGTAQRARWVSEILVLEPSEEARGYATTSVFRARAGEREATPGVLPDDYRDLEVFGFDLRGYYEQQVAS